MQFQASTVLDTAWKRGIRCFDAARSYGRAEAFLGTWLREREIDPGSVTVGSKWGYTYTADWRVDADTHEVKDHTLPALLRQRAESVASLAEYLNLYQIHSATLESGVLDDVPVLDQLMLYKSQGLAIGLSLSGTGQAQTLCRAMRVQPEGLPLFDVVQATWNLIERTVESALAEAHATGMGVIVKEALANGRLTSRNADPTFSTQRAILEEIAAEQGVGVDALALAAALAQPWADVVLSGAARVDHLNSNLDAFKVGWTDEIDQRLISLTESPETYWGKRRELSWN
jgi:aryl-alcohol dehydrogenase-like predicted oxidoreductase